MSRSSLRSHEALGRRWRRGQKLWLLERGEMPAPWHLIETLRGLLFGTSIDNSGAIAVGWCVAISLFGFLWAMKLYDRDPEHR